MGEEVRMKDYPDCNGDDDDRISEWEVGLPSADDLTPLFQSLISPELASAFSISPEPFRSMMDVNLASENTLSGIRSQFQGGLNLNLKSSEDDRSREELDLVPEEPDLEGSDSRKMRRIDDSAEEAGSATRTENGNDESSAAKTQKRARLVWTPQLHKRFVDVVGHLGIKNAVPKTIMQMMNVEGLTRENVASHLQKYRLYLKRMQGLSNEGPSPSDHLFASTPVPPSLRESGGGHLQPPSPMAYSPQMMQMPVMGMGHMGMTGGNSAASGSPYHGGYESHHYSMMQQRDWSGGNKFGSIGSYQQQRATHNNDR